MSYQITNLLSPQKKSLQRANSTQKELPEIYSKRNRSSRGADIYELNNVFLLYTKQQQIVFDETGKILHKFSFIENRNNSHEYIALLNRLFSALPKENLSGKTCSLFTPGGDIFYHWNLDLLPKIKLLEMHGLKPNDFKQVIINSISRTYEVESFQQLNIDSSNIIEFSLNTVYKCESLLIPKYLGLYQEQFSIDFLKENFLKKEIKFKTNKRVLISRGNAKRRRLLHEDSIMNLLKPLGFEKVILDELSIFEQAAIFNQSEFIISAHGANLTGLVYCQPTCKVLELFSHHNSGAYWSISNTLDLDYWALADKRSKKDLNETMPTHKRRQADIDIPPNKIKKVVEKMLQGSKDANSL